MSEVSKDELTSVAVTRAVLWEIPRDLLTDDFWLVKAISLFLIPILVCLYPLMVYMCLFVDLLKFVLLSSLTVPEGRERQGAGVVQPQSRGAIRCAFCHDGFSSAQPARTCGGCGSVRHQACVAESTQACPTLGCAHGERSPVPA